MSGGSLERRGGAWRLRVSETDPRTGKRTWHTRTVHVMTKTEARHELAQFEADVLTGKVPRSRHVTLAEFVRLQFLPNLDRGLSPTTGRPYSVRTKERYLWSIERYIVPGIGNVALAKLDLARLEGFRDTLLHGTGLEGPTVGDILAVTKSVLGYARRLGYLDRDPAEFLVLPSRKRVREMVKVTPELARAALRAAGGTDLDVGVHLALGGSLRREEVLALRVGDIDLDRGVARISRVLVAFRRPAPGVLAEPVFAPPKTAAGAREVELPPFVVKRLRGHLREQAKRRLLFGDQWRGAKRRDDDLVVEKGDGSPWRPDSYTRKWTAIAKQIDELEGLTFHGNRHGFGTLLLVGGVDVKIVSELMGHSSTSVTREIYQAVIPRLRKEAGKALDTLIGDPNGPERDQFGDQ